MRLSRANNEHIIELMSWFSNEQQLKMWSGPNFDYPFTEKSFKKGLCMDSLSSFALLNEDNQFIAFGQYYLRENRCHLGRLVVKANCRGQGVIAELIKKLTVSGEKFLGVKSSSLFVLADNNSAIQAYQKSGFVLSTYPEKVPLDNCLYMIKE